jgi:hypothetical protein
LGFSNWPVILLHQQTPTSFLAPSSPSHQQVFWRRCRGRVEDFCEGSFRTHILYFGLLFCFTLFILPASFFIKNPKKLESLVAVISLLLVHHAVP